jgi:thiol-disulfide isomerase/thioredoxin
MEGCLAHYSYRVEGKFTIAAQRSNARRSVNVRSTVSIWRKSKLVRATMKYDKPLLQGIFFTALLVALASPRTGLGDAAPGFSLPLLSGSGTINLGELRGYAVYVDFWASWCGPCRRSLPLYEALNQRLPSERFRLVAINLDERREDALLFLQDHPVTYDVAFDPTGESAATWNIKAMPSSFLVGPDGSVVREWAGFEPSHLEEIESEIWSIIK